MQKIAVLSKLTVVALLPLALIGCKPQEKQADAAAAEQQVEEAKTAVELPAQELPATQDPAAAKPKDHPAH